VLAVSAGLFAPGDAARQRTVAFTLAPVGDRGTTDSTNLVLIPREANEVRLQFEVADLSATDSLDIVVESLTGAIVAPGIPVRVTQTANASHVELTMASSDLPDGDYVLRLRHAALRGDDSIVATRAFRVIHN